MSPSHKRRKVKKTRRRNRRLIFASFFAVLFAVVIVFLVSPQQPTEPEVELTGNVIEVRMSASEYKFQPSLIEAKLGDKIRIIYVNDGTRRHNFVIDAFGIRTRIIEPGETEVIEFVVDKVGEFKFWCSLLGHREFGMEGTLIVSQA